MTELEGFCLGLAATGRPYGGTKMGIGICYVNSDEIENRPRYHGVGKGRRLASRAGSQTRKSHEVWPPYGGAEMGIGICYVNSDEIENRPQFHLFFAPTFCHSGKLMGQIAPAKTTIQK